MDAVPTPARESVRPLLTTVQRVLLASLRIAIGWHFLYEGLSKLLSPGWSAAGYLEVSRWWFSGFFHWIAANPLALQIANQINIWGLLLVGLALMLGFWTRPAAIAGMVLLLAYWAANPPLVGLGLAIPAEGSYLAIDKNVVEFFALAVLLAFGAGRFFGLDGLLARPRAATAEGGEELEAIPAVETAGSGEAALPVMRGRREVLASLAGLPFLGAFALAVVRKERWKSYEARNLVDAVTAASTKALNVASLSELKDPLPIGEIKGLPLSRVILGGNLLSGYAHARDLIYVSDLVKAYHTKERIFATLLMAEKCGVNTLLTNPILATLIEEYWRRDIGKIQFISDCAGLVYGDGEPYLEPFETYLDRVRRAIDYGASACYIQGETADWFIRNNRVDLLDQTLELIRGNGVVTGVGAHAMETIVACVEHGIKPDFWMKTLHHHNYWSAGHPTWHDNKFCGNPEETIAYMSSLPQPWIAFKVLAAGAIRPEDGLRYAFSNGADFVCLGMYDFQMVKNVNTAVEVLRTSVARERPWMGGPLVV